MAVPYSRTIVGDLPWYSVLVVAGIALAVWLASVEEKRLGLPQDTAVDLALVVVPFGIVGARLYYVLMSWEMFVNHPVSVLYVWQGGLAIYGGVIGGAVGAWLYTKKKKIRFALVADMIAPGLLLAQAVGRWGNYFNMEAYGSAITDARLQFFPLAVWIPLSGKWHAATFFYESLWNLSGFAALWKIRRKQQAAGNVFAWYLLIYGAGRFIIEQLRQDSLYLGNMRVSQWLSLALCTAAALLLMYRACKASKKCWMGCAVCVLLWIARWGMLESHGGYALLLVAAGIAALWIERENKKSLFWMIAALVLDGAGLLAAITSWPFDVAASGFHAAACSITLPVCVGTLCIGQEK